MTKIDAYFPSHAKRAKNFQRNVEILLKNESAVTSYDLYDYRVEEAKQTRNLLTSLKMTDSETKNLERRLDKYDVLTANETIAGVLIFSGLRSVLLLLNDDIDMLCANFGGQLIPTASTIIEQPELNLGRWVFNSIYLFTDK